MASDPLHIARNGAEIGAYALDDVRSKLAAGELLSGDFYWRPGMADWKPLATLFVPARVLPFARPEVKDPNFFDGIMGRENRTAGLVLLWDQLAKAPVECLVSEAAIAKIDEAVGYKVRRRCREELEAWYAQAASSYLADRLFANEERADLGNLAITFGLTPERAGEVHKQAFKDYLGTGLRTCLLREAPPEEKARQLALLTHEVMLPAADIAEVRQKAIEEYILTSVQAVSETIDGVDIIDPAKLAEITAQALAMGIRLHEALPELTGRIQRSAGFWSLYKAPLTPVETELELGSETCFWSQKVEFYQKKKVTIGRTYSGFSSSIKIFGPIRYRMGNYDVQRETEEQTVQIDTGTLAFTSQRVIFKGELKNFNFKYSKILDVSAFSDAIVIARDTGGDNIYLFPSGQLEAAVILRRMMRQAKS